MNLSGILSNHTTQVSGGVTLLSAASSKTAEYVVSSSEMATPEMMETATRIVISADTLAICSFVVMLCSAIFNVYIQRKKAKHDERLLAVRIRELELREKEIEDGRN